MNLPITNGQSCHLSRRRVLGQAAALVGAACLGSGTRPRAMAQDAEGKQATDLAAIDAHSHIWTPDVNRYPLAEGFTPQQMAPPSFTPRQLLSHARPCGVGRVVLIQMSYYRFDNSYMLCSMREFPGVFSGVAVVDEHAKDVASTMRELKRQGVRGFRIHPERQPVEPWLASEGMATMWRTGADEQLAICALVNPDALVPLDRMCERFPQTRLVVDHFARIGVDGTIRDADVARLCNLARHRNTYVKVSAFYALGKKQAPYTDLAPMIRRLVESFGPERLMWATDCPYQVENGHTYRDSIELVRSRLDFLSAEDRAWMLGKTAERVFFN